MANCNYKVNLTDIQNKYKFKIFSLGSYNDSDLRKMIESVFYALPRVSGSGTSVTLTDTAFSYMKNKLYATDTSQTGTPTPDSPQPINLVSGDNTINVCGKNIFNPSKIISNTGLNQDGTTYYSASRAYLDYTSVKPNTTYSYSGFTNKAIQYFDNSKTFLSGEQPTSETFTTPNNCYYIRYCFDSTVDYTQAQIELGNTTTYKAYTGQTYPINLPVENLAQYDTNEYTSSALSNLGAFNITLDNSVDINTSDTYYFSADIRLKSGTGNYMNTIRSGNNTGQTATQLINPNLTSDYQRYVFKCTYSQSQTLTQVAFQISNGSSAVLEIKNIMISKINASYTPYGTTPIELCKIENYEDKIFKAIKGNEIYDSLTNEEQATLDYGKWYLRKNIGKVVLNGSETGWNRTGTSTSGNYYFFISNLLSNVLFDSNNRFTGMSNIGITTNAYQGVQGVDTILYNSNKTTRVYTETTKTMSVDDFKTWLSTHNTTVYYVLATPTNIKFNDTIQDQLEDIYNNMLSYEGTTNISQENADLPFNIEATAIKDLNSL